MYMCLSASRALLCNLGAVQKDKYICICVHIYIYIQGAISNQ